MKQEKKQKKSTKKGNKEEKKKQKRKPERRSSNASEYDPELNFHKYHGGREYLFKTNTHKGYRMNLGERLTVKDLYPVLRALELGMSRKRACYIGGISNRRFIDLMKIDDELSYYVHLAEAKAEQSMVAILHRLARKGNVKAVMFLLERRFPAEWGRREVQTFKPSEIAGVEIDFSKFEETNKKLKLIQKKLGIVSDN